MKDFYFWVDWEAMRNGNRAKIYYKGVFQFELPNQVEVERFGHMIAVMIEAREDYSPGSKDFRRRWKLNEFKTAK